MTPERRFPFGDAPAEVTVSRVVARAETTIRLPGTQTVPLTDFQPGARVLPFCAPPPPAPFVPLVSEEPFSLVPPLPPRAPARSRVSLRSVATVVLVVLNVAMLVYLVATWGR